MCVFGGIAGALGAAAVACAMISTTHAEPVPYHAGDIFVTHLDGVDDPPELNCSSQQADIEGPGVRDNKLASFDRASSSDALGVRALTNSVIEDNANGLSVLLASADADLLRPDDHARPIRLLDSNAGETNALTILPFDNSHPTLIPLPAAVWSGAIGLCVAGVIITRMKHHHS